MTQASGSLYHRGGNASGWSGSWREILDGSNYTSYVPKKDGTGASGTWGIGITGNAATATKLATARTINGVSFDGSANVVVYSPTEKAPILKSGIKTQTWYRVAVINTTHFSGTMTINSSWGNSDGTQVSLKMSIGYGSKEVHIT
jgi:hypothetical protein